jgi:hypothetical protein
MMPSPPQSDRSLGDLLADLTQEIVTLVRQELSLARAELSHKATHIGRNIGLIAVAGMVAYAGLLAILAALILALSQLGLPLWGASLLIGTIVVVSGAIVAMRAIHALRQEDLVPRQTLQSLQEIK